MLAAPSSNLNPSQPLRKLGVSISDSEAAPDQPQIAKVATAGDGQIVPFSKERLIAIGAAPTQILGANPNRKAVILRSVDVAAQYLVLGSVRNWPPVVDSTNRVGVIVFGQESLTLETTDEVWIVNLLGNMTIVGCEILQSSAAK